MMDHVSSEDEDDKLACDTEANQEKKLLRMKLMK